MRMLAFQEEPPRPGQIDSLHWKHPHISLCEGRKGRIILLDAARQAVVACLLSQGVDGLLEAHVEAQTFAHVVLQLPVDSQLTPHTTGSSLQTMFM